MYILPDNRGQPRLSAVLLPDIRGQSRLSAVLAVNGMGMALLHTYTLYIAARMLQNGGITFVSIRPVDRRVDRNHSTVTTSGAAFFVLFRSLDLGPCIDRAPRPHFRSRGVCASGHVVLEHTAHQ